jgi:uncharacterized protein
MKQGGAWSALIIALRLMLLTAAVLAPAGTAHSEAAPGEKRVALVIGNSAYAHAPALPNPRNDAKALASALRRLGFSEVIERADLTHAQLIAELRAFGDAATGADWAVVFYAGHGVQVDGQNYLIPIDATLAHASDIEEEAIPLTRVSLRMRETKKLRLIILDACRDNPFAVHMEQSSRKRSLGRGLARVEPESGELIAYATRDGQQADDGPEGHSPFTAGLLAHIERPGVEINLLFREIRDAVMTSTNNSQEPLVYGSLPAKLFYFKAPPPAPEHPAVTLAPDAKRSEAGELWLTLKDTTSEAQLQQFIKEYGDTAFARYAQARLGELKIRAADAAMAECDRLAASSSNDERKDEGVDPGKIDFAHAVPACRKAISMSGNIPRLMFQLGRALKAKGEYPEARAWYEKAAAAGHGGAMNNLGDIYHSGYGVPKDHAKALELFEKAAATGHAFAMKNIGAWHRNGFGGAPDYAKAREWFEKAADKGDANAMNDLGELYRYGQGVTQDYAKAREWYEKAIDKDNAHAMNNLGVLYHSGQGVAQDYVKAREWFEKAANKGNAHAMSNLGVLYHSGQGVAQDYVKAREWFEKAADKGLAVAMSNLGNLYAEGHGVRRDTAKAREWCEKALSLGYTKAKDQLDKLNRLRSGGRRR